MPHEENESNGAAKLVTSGAFKIDHAAAARMTRIENEKRRVKFCPNCGSSTKIVRRGTNFDALTGKQNFREDNECTRDKVSWWDYVYDHECNNMIGCAQNQINTDARNALEKAERERKQGGSDAD